MNAIVFNFGIFILTDNMAKKTVCTLALFLRTSPDCTLRRRVGAHHVPASWEKLPVVAEVA
jgi:hypothetical protein